MRCACGLDKVASSVFKRDTSTNIIRTTLQLFQIIDKEPTKNCALQRHNRHPKREAPKILKEDPFFLWHLHYHRTDKCKSYFTIEIIVHALDLGLKFKHYIFCSCRTIQNMLFSPGVKHYGKKASAGREATLPLKGKVNS